jgi:hypothetical protein
MLRQVFLAATLLCGGCSTYAHHDPLTPDQAVTPEAGRQIRALLDKLYHSFNYPENQEPDWAMMRSCFVDGALFAPEPDAGEAIRPRDVDALIAGWQAAMRRRASHPGYSEWIDRVSISQVGKIVRADVVFYGREAGDTQPRRPGLDSLQLVQVDGEWRVLSFVVQSESKLQGAHRGT